MIALDSDAERRLLEIGNDLHSHALARVTTLEAIVTACQARRKQLGLPQLAVDDLSGLHSGYTAKLECGLKGLGKLSLPLLLGALKLELAVVPQSRLHQSLKQASSLASSATSALSTDYFRRRTAKARAAALLISVSTKTIRARKAALARAAALSPERRSEIARKAAKARAARWNAETQAGDPVAGCAGRPEAR